LKGFLKEFLTIGELSKYLNLKRSTLYGLVESGELPHYKIGRLIRFRKSDVDRWMEDHRRENIKLEEKAKRILKVINTSRMDVDRLIKKSIEEVKENGYTFSHGRPDQDKAKKEVEHGTLS